MAQAPHEFFTFTFTTRLHELIIFSPFLAYFESSVYSHSLLEHSSTCSGGGHVLQSKGDTHLHSKAKQAALSYSDVSLMLPFALPSGGRLLSHRANEKSYGQSESDLKVT